MEKRLSYGVALDRALDALVKVEGFDAETYAKLKELRVSLQNRSASRSAKKADANAQFKGVVLDALRAVGKPATVTELLATGVFEVNTTNQRVSAILKQMVENDKTVIKEVDKKKSYFAIAKTFDEDVEVED